MLTLIKQVSVSICRSELALNPLLELTSKPQLEQEYAFNATMTGFLRALRAGVIQVQQGAVLLAHYGRLGPAFDLSSKLMIDILREEGMYKDNGQLVVDVVVNSLKEVSSSLLPFFFLLRFTHSYSVIHSGA